MLGRLSLLATGTRSTLIERLKEAQQNEQALSQANVVPSPVENGGDHVELKQQFEHLEQQQVQDLLDRNPSDERLLSESELTQVVSRSSCGERLRWFVISVTSCCQRSKPVECKCCSFCCSRKPQFPCRSWDERGYCQHQFLYIPADFRLYSRTPSKACERRLLGRVYGTFEIIAKKIHDEPLTLTVENSAIRVN